VVMIAGLVTFKDYKQDHPVYRTPWPELICMGANVVGCGLLGRWLNRKAPLGVFELDLAAPRSHSFLFVRVGYCGVFSVLFFGYLIWQGTAFR
jgi:hypothetical protein